MCKDDMFRTCRTVGYHQVNPTVRCLTRSNITNESRLNSEFIERPLRYTKRTSTRHRMNHRSPTLVTKNWIYYLLPPLRRGGLCPLNELTSASAGEGPRLGEFWREPPPRPPRPEERPRPDREYRLEGPAGTDDCAWLRPRPSRGCWRKEDDEPRRGGVLPRC